MGTWTLERKGRFSVPRLQVKNYCGSNRQRTFEYHFWITVDELDDYNFVVDQFEANTAIEEAYLVGKWEASCEDLVCGVLHLLRDIAGRRATAIRVEVKPTPLASVSFDWEWDEDLPTNMPRRVDAKHKAEPVPA